MVAAGGAILVLLGLLPGDRPRSSPRSRYPVLGGAGIVLFGTVAASGIRTLSKVDYDDNLNMVIVAVAIAVGLIPIAAPKFWDAFPSGSAPSCTPGISAAALVAVVLNVLFNEIRGGEPAGRLGLRRRPRRKGQPPAIRRTLIAGSPARPLQQPLHSRTTHPQSTKTVARTHPDPPADQRGSS